MTTVERLSQEQTIQQLSDNAFKDHVIREQSRNGVFRSWRCEHKDGGSAYYFDITTIPGSLVITGDLGGMIVTRAYDMLPWCRNAVDSTAYFAQKVEREFKLYEFSPARLHEWIVDQLAHAEDYGLTDEHVNLLLEHRDSALDTDMADSWWYDLFDTIFQGDPPDWRDYTSRFYWLRDAIRWFVQHTDEAPILQPERQPRSNERRA